MFKAFTADNDPCGEHDFGAFDHQGQRIFWKIDYYAPDMEHGSEDPADARLPRFESWQRPAGPRGFGPRRSAFGNREDRHASAKNREQDENLQGVSRIPAQGRGCAPSSCAALSRLITPLPRG